MQIARRLVCLYLWPVALAGGCAPFIDEVTSRDFTVKQLFARPDPLHVLRESDDDTQRAYALKTLQEPLQHGGNERDQEGFLQILSKSATADRDALCRIAAIRALGHWKDPRAAQALATVTEQKLTFTADTNNLVRVEAIKALAATGSPLAVERLVQVAKEPPAEGSAQDRQEWIDRRVAAIRGLGRYNSPQAADTLLHVLQSERDAALRQRAHESLVAVTGKHYPPDAAMWTQHLHPEQRREGDALAREEPNRFWDTLMWPIRQVRGY